MKMKDNDVRKSLKDNDVQHKTDNNEPKNFSIKKNIGTQNVTTIA